MNKFIFSTVLILTVALAGCGNSSEENINGTIKNDTATNDTTNSNNGATKENEEKENT